MTRREFNYHYRRMIPGRCYEVTPSGKFKEKKWPTSLLLIDVIFRNDVVSSGRNYPNYGRNYPISAQRQSNFYESYPEFKSQSGDQDGNHWHSDHR